MINTVICDIGNVLAGFKWEEYLSECGYDEETKKRIGDATVRSGLWDELDRSAVMEQEFMERFTSQDPGLREEILDFLDQSRYMVTEYDYSASFLRELKNQGYKVYILSNYNGRNFRYAREHFQFLGLIDGGIISYEVGYVKPEQEIYNALIDRYKIRPEEAVFIDDVLQNIKTAASLGFHTIHFNNFDQMTKELKRLFEQP